jgi:hypothetical protein
MAKKPAAHSDASGEPAEIDVDAQYAVMLKRAVKHGATWLRPSDRRVRVSGATLNAIIDDVTFYELVK